MAGFKEQRRFPRFEFYAMVRFAGARQTVSFPVRNISLGGAFLAVDAAHLAKLAVGVERQVTVFDGNDEENRATVTGRIVRLEAAGVGVQWVGDDDAFKIDALTSVHSLQFEMPERVATSFREAQRCRAAGSWVAAAVMVRRALEAVVCAFDPESDNLCRGLAAMHDRGHISEELRAWSDQLRCLGNDAAHPSNKAVSGQDCEDATQFLVVILRTLYELRPKLEELRLRRAR